MGLLVKVTCLVREILAFRLETNFVVLQLLHGREEDLFRRLGLGSEALDLRGRHLGEGSRVGLNFGILDEESSGVSGGETNESENGDEFHCVRVCK